MYPTPSLWVEYSRAGPEKDRVRPLALCYRFGMDLLTRFAGNVRRLRSKKKLSQKALADKVGISVSYVSMLERGQRSPPLETIEKMAKALGVPPASLLGK